MVSLRGLGADPDCSPEILLLSPENPLHLSDKDVAQGPQICRPGLSGDILLGPLWIYRETEAQQRQDPQAKKRWGQDTRR